MKRNVFYSKNNPQEVTEAYFLQELMKRNEKTQHISSFGHFIDFCKNIRKQIHQN